jgi:hypothetical protein
MNMRALVLHVLGDALGNVGVIATGLNIMLAPASWNGREVYFDPAISLVIVCIILGSAVPLGACRVLPSSLIPPLLPLPLPSQWRYCDTAMSPSFPFCV